MAIIAFDGVLFVLESPLIFVVLYFVETLLLKPSKEKTSKYCNGKQTLIEIIRSIYFNHCHSLFITILLPFKNKKNEMREQKNAVDGRCCAQKLLSGSSEPILFSVHRPIRLNNDWRFRSAFNLRDTKIQNSR